MKNITKIILTGILLLVVIGIIYSLIPNKQETLKIGAILPLTGEASFWGQNAQRGILLATEDINNNGGVSGKKLEIVFEDSFCDAKKSVDALSKLLNVDGIDFFIGDICSSATLAMAPLAEQNKKILITPCSESADISKAGDYIFRTFPPNTQQALSLARYAKNSLKLDRIALLHMNNAFGESLAREFKQEFERLGGIVTSQEKAAEETTDFKTLLVKIQKTQPEGLVLAFYGPKNVKVIQQIHELGLDLPLLSPGTINTPEFLDESRGLEEGIIFADISDPTTESYRQRYKTRFGEDWPGVSSCAGVSYDAVGILSKALEEVGEDPTKVKNYFYTMQYEGVSGLLDFNEYGDLTWEYSIYVFEKNKKFKQLA